MTSRSVILLDFDNIFLRLWQVDRDLAMRFGNEPTVWLPLLAGWHPVDQHRRWLVARCYLNPAGSVPRGDDAADRLYFSKFRPGLVRAGFEVVDCPTLTGGGKNAADIRLVIDALDLLGAECRYGEFVIASGDSDFAPLLQRLRAQDRRITVISPRPCSAAYSSLADQLLDLAALEALLLPKPAEPEGEAVPAGDEGRSDLQAFHAFVASRYAEATDPLNLSSLAQTVLRAFPKAREQGWFGSGRFSVAVARIGLPNAQLEQHYLWDAGRHVPPVGLGIAAPAELPPPAVLLAHTVDLPQLEQAV